MTPGLKEKLIITVVDKALIGLIVAFAAYWLNRYLEAYKSKLALENDLAKVREQERREQNSRERQELLRLRSALDGDGDLTAIVQVLRLEKSRADFEPMNGAVMRKLPAFLEDVAQHWRFGVISLPQVDDAFGEEVLLCDDSKLMWRDEDDPKSDAFWGTFKRLAQAIRKFRTTSAGNNASY